MSDQKVGILNAIQTLVGVNAADAVVKVITTNAVDEITTEMLEEVGVAKTKAANTVAALELHLALSKVSKPRAERTTVAQRYAAETTEQERDSMAWQVAVRRINVEGTKPRAWRSIREELGLKNEQFHKVIRLGDGWKLACLTRIAQLRQQPGGWEYSGKLEVLVGFDLSIEDVIAFEQYVAEKQEQEAAEQEVLALPAPSDDK